MQNLSFILIIWPCYGSAATSSLVIMVHLSCMITCPECATAPSGSWAWAPPGHHDTNGRRKVNLGPGLPWDGAESLHPDSCIQGNISALMSTKLAIMYEKLRTRNKEMAKIHAPWICLMVNNLLFGKEGDLSVGEGAICCICFLFLNLKEWGKKTHKLPHLHLI